MSLKDILVTKGIEDDKAQFIQDRISYSDLMELMSYFDDDTEESRVKINQILSNFGVKINEMKYNYMMKASKNMMSKLSESKVPHKEKNGIVFLSLTESQKEGFDNNKKLQELAGIVPSFSGEDVITTIPDEYMDDMSTPSVDANFDSVDGSTEVPVDNSEEYNQIQDFLNSIQSLMPDIRLCEYKPLMIKVQELNDQVKNMAKNYF